MCPYDLDGANCEISLGFGCSVTPAPRRCNYAPPPSNSFLGAFSPILDGEAPCATLDSGPGGDAVVYASVDCRFGFDTFEGPADVVGRNLSNLGFSWEPDFRRLNFSYLVLRQRTPADDHPLLALSVLPRRPLALYAKPTNFVYLSDKRFSYFGPPVTAEALRDPTKVYANVSLPAADAPMWPNAGGRVYVASGEKKIIDMFF